MGYRSNHFARNLRNQTTNTIGVIVGKLNSYFQATVIAGIESVANQEGYNLIISQSSESFEKEKASAKTMFNNRVDVEAQKKTCTKDFKVPRCDKSVCNHECFFYGDLVFGVCTAPTNCRCYYKSIVCG
jgi:hypothetical protein